MKKMTKKEIAKRQKVTQKRADFTKARSTKKYKPSLIAGKLAKLKSPPIN
ncbi:hypothetical protein H7171_01295 [Candidatus Saccharibacteria bacterium]|nr:hypothetical protein [Candidatus Saccharibacteria bacterium]